MYSAKYLLTTYGVCPNQSATSSASFSRPVKSCNHSHTTTHTCRPHHPEMIQPNQQHPHRCMRRLTPPPHLIRCLGSAASAKLPPRARAAHAPERYICGTTRSRTRTGKALSTTRARVCSTPPLRSVRLYVSCQPWQPWGSRRRRTRRGAGGTRSTGTRRGCARSACATASRASPPRSPALPRRRRRRRRRRDPPPRCARRPGRGVTPPRRRPRRRPAAAARGWAC